MKPREDEDEMEEPVKSLHLSGNGKSGPWLVSLDEEAETGRLNLWIEFTEKIGNMVSRGSSLPVRSERDLHDLIVALQQVQLDLNSKD